MPLIGGAAIKIIQLAAKRRKKRKLKVVLNLCLLRFFAAINGWGGISDETMVNKDFAWR